MARSPAQWREVRLDGAKSGSSWLLDPDRRVPALDEASRADNNLAVSIPPDRSDVPRPRRGGRAARRVSISDALDAIADDSRIYFSAGCAVPVGLLEAMDAERHRWDRIEFVTELLLEAPPPFQHPGEPFHLTSLQPSRACAAMDAAGVMDVVPSSLRQWAPIMATALPIDVAVVHVSPPGPEGRFSLGIAVGTPIEVINHAPIVIAQVNPQMPYSIGAGELDPDEIDFLVDVDHPLVEMSPATIDDTARSIAAHVVDLIPDGAVLQFGIGAIPEVVLGSLHERRDLGIHSGMVGDSVVGLAASGAVTGATKPRWPGVISTGLALGTRPLFDFLHNNRDVLMLPAAMTHGPDVLAQFNGLIAINSAIEVALDGSVNAEATGSKLLSGPGGQPDYAFGLSLGPASRSIVALPSTAGGGAYSRIVPVLGEGSPVTVARYLADTVVTEHGVAELRKCPTLGPWKNLHPSGPSRTPASPS